MAIKVQPPKTPAEQREEHKENLIALAIAIIVVGAVAFFIWHSVTAPFEAPSERVNVPLGGAPTLGSPNASVTVVIFSDFECPYCGDFARDTFPQVKERFIDTGKVRFVFRHFPIGTHQYAFGAAEAAVCAQDQGKFWEYHDLLYANQRALDTASLQSYARQAGLDAGVFDSCLLDNERASDVTADRDAGLHLGVSGTPTFFFNGRQVAGTLTIDEFALNVQQELAGTAS